jgi:hypothetical protein
MIKSFRLNNKAVSQVIGYVLTFAIISATTVTVVYTMSVLLERRATAATQIIAQDIANHVVDAITECIAMKQEFPDANYSRVINVPLTINGRNYYIEANDERVYVNTTDGQISAKSTTYKQEELCIGISGKVYPSSGKIRVYVNKSDYLYRIDFGTDDSPGEYGYARMSSSSLYRSNWWDINWAYRAPIYIYNGVNEDFTGYQIRLVLNTQNFDYNNANENGSDIRFTNKSGVELPYWIEKWEYNGLSYIWFRADKILANQTTTFYIYYGNPSAPPQSNGKAVFEFFDDFDSFDPSVWEVYPQNSENISVKNGYLEISNGTAIVTKHNVFTDGALRVKAKAISTRTDTEASMLTRCQNRTHPYDDAYFFSSGSFSTSYWKNFSIGKFSNAQTFVLNYDNTSMKVNEWYLLIFQLDGEDIIASRIEYFNPIFYETLTVSDSSYSSGYFGLFTTNGCRAKYDWIIYHKVSPYTFDVTIAAPASLYYTFTEYNNLSFVDHPSVSNNLNRDDVASTQIAVMQLSIPSPGKYSVTVTIGEPYYSLGDINIYAENKLMISNFGTDPGYISSRWFVVDVSDGLLDLKFEYTGSHPEGFWSITSIIVEKGIKGVRLGGMG